MTTPPPAKFKAYLGRLKENVLDSDTQNVDEAYGALISTELAQRGVLVDMEGDNAEKLMDAVISTAGRSLVGSLPKPLLSASSVMTGMIAESCCTLVASGQTTTLFSSSFIQTALTRCRDVEDNRLASLLELLGTEESQETLLLHIAEGSFLRAASIQPDSPQMWKRSLDAIERRLHANPEPFEAGLPLSHLIRIAHQKENAKRVSELSLRLTESWLSPKEGLTSKLEKDLVEAFVTPYRPSDSFSESECVEHARLALQQINIEHIEDNQENLLSYKLLNFRIEWALEQTKIDNLAAEKVLAAKNRGTSASLESCKLAARSEVFVESLQYDSLNESANDLRDLMLLSSDLTSLGPRETGALELLEQQSDRLVERACAVSLASKSKKPTCTLQEACVTWSDVISFTKPIVQEIGVLSKWDSTMTLKEREKSVSDMFALLSPKFRLFLQSALIPSSCWAWMTCNQETGYFDLSLLELTLDSLSVCLRLEQQHVSASQDDTVLKSSQEEGGHLVELECAHASMLSLVGLARVGEGNDRSTLLAHEAARKATAMMDKAEKYQAQQGKFGSTYLLSLLAWSGMYRSPWPFCNVTQARSIIRGARASVQSATASWGRDETSFESILLDLSEADAEGGSLIGGFEKNAEGLYTTSLQKSGTQPNDIDGCVLSLLKAHCQNGLAKLRLHGKYSEDTTSASAAQNLAEMALADSTIVRGETSSPFYLWKSQDASGASALFHINVARQLVADSLVRASRPADAQEFLEDAVRDDPTDFDAAFALGAFRLRMAWYESRDASPEEQKMAQTQLLKSAKLNSEKSDPFALLGMWYEVHNDLKRALGCYSKALLLDASHPVAGRGVLRLKSPGETKRLCENATNSNSPVNGWAWQAIGREKAMMENDDELAVICFLQALRCRDIECPQNEALSIFFAPPTATESTCDLSNVWAELAGCYRRVGRFAAAERAFYSAWQVDRDRLPSQVLCSWAQVELELGLCEEAIEKFELVLEREEDFSQTIAAYGQGYALLALAHRDAGDGKAGVAFQHASRAIARIERTFLGNDSALSQKGCALKLLGDLYSFGALLPPDVFVDRVDKEVGIYEHSQNLLRAQASFVAKGEKAYRDGAKAHLGFDKDDDALRASILCDLGGNILLQGQILSSAFGEAQGGTPEMTLKDVIESDSEVKRVYDRSVEVFKSTIIASPLHGPAWCGLGCSLFATDPLLAQHAFCTALTLDKMMPDSWSNLAFLFAANDASAQSAEMLDGLTQVADSPLMWICRAVLLENQVQSRSAPSEAQLSWAADAYRAALQVVKHPTALLGLSLTCRASISGNQCDGSKKSVGYSKISSDLSRQDSSGYISEYLGLSSSCNIGSFVLAGVMALEDVVDCLKVSRHDDQAWRYDGVEQARDRISIGLEGLCRISSRSSTREAELRGVDQDEVKNVIEHISISSIVSAADSAAEIPMTTSKPSPFVHDLTPMRRVMNDPESGTAWLDFAKSLAKEVLAVSDCKKKRAIREVLESAVRAGDRAAQILSNQLSNPMTLRAAPQVAASDDSEEEAVVSAGVVPVSVDAREVSEALALAYWLETVEMEVLSEARDAHGPKRNIDLQKALFMDPGNTFACQALKNSIPSS